MKIRNAILAICASVLAFGLTATTGICEGLEKTFLGGDASVGRAKSRNDAGGTNSNVVVPTDSRDVTRSKAKTNQGTGGSTTEIQTGARIRF